LESIAPYQATAMINVEFKQLAKVQLLMVHWNAQLGVVLQVWP
jgi:hypothetical protein